MKTIARLTRPQTDRLSEILAQAKIPWHWEEAPESHQTNPVYVIKVEDKHFRQAREKLQQLRNESPDLLNDEATSPGIHNIVVPVDFSEYSLAISRLATRLAVKYKAKIWLTHAYHTPVVDTMSPEGYTARVDIVMDELQQAAKDSMQHLLDKMEAERETLQQAGASVETLLLNATPENIVHVIHDFVEPDLYIIGTQGKGEEKRKLVGSVAGKIITDAEHPVLALPITSDFKGSEYLQKVMYATDFDESDFSAMRKLMKLLRPFQPEVHFVHIRTKSANKWNEMRLKGLKDYFANAYNYDNVKSAIIEQQDVQKGIYEYAEKNGIELIALTTHKRGFLAALFQRSIAREVLNMANLPILTFHAGE